MTNYEQAFKNWLKQLKFGIVVKGEHFDGMNKEKCNVFNITFSARDISTYETLFFYWHRSLSGDQPVHC